MSHRRSFWRCTKQRPKMDGWRSSAQDAVLRSHAMQAQYSRSVNGELTTLTCPLMHSARTQRTHTRRTPRTPCAHTHTRRTHCHRSPCLLASTGQKAPRLPRPWQRRPLQPRSGLVDLPGDGAARPPTCQAAAALTAPAGGLNRHHGGLPVEHSGLLGRIGRACSGCDVARRAGRSRWRWCCSGPTRALGRHAAAVDGAAARRRRRYTPPGHDRVGSRGACSHVGAKQS